MIINDLFLLVNTNKKYEFPTFSHIKVNNKMIKFFQIYKYFQNRTTVDWNIILEDLPVCEGDRGNPVYVNEVNKGKTTSTLVNT